MDKSQKDVTQSVVEGHLFAFYQSQEVFDYALHRSPLDRLTTTVLINDIGHGRANMAALIYEIRTRKSIEQQILCLCSYS